MGECECCNCGYLCSKHGLCKLLTVILGLIAASLTLSGFDMANSKIKYVDNGVSNEVPGYFYRSPHGGNSSEEVCVLVYEENEKLPVKLNLAPCPREWMILWAVLLIWISFAASGVVLVVLLLCSLNKNGCFNMLDMIGHFNAGMALLVAAGFLITFVVQVVNAHKCDTGSDKMIKWCKRDIWHREYAVFHFAVAGGFSIVNGLIYLGTAVGLKSQK